MKRRSCSHSNRTLYNVLLLFLCAPKEEEVLGEFNLNRPHISGRWLAVIPHPVDGNLVFGMINRVIVTWSMVFSMAIGCALNVCVWRAKKKGIGESRINPGYLRGNKRCITSCYTIEKIPHRSQDNPRFPYRENTHQMSQIVFRKEGWWSY